ncbi:MAG: ISLre2 family transposase [Eubacteriales bacterium]|nr:ISLre2 family transposase [Eubacteriales bacterium]
MNNSIRYFTEKSINIFEKLEENFFKDPKNLYSYITGITEELHNLGRMMLQESLEEMNQMLIDSGVRKADWYIEKHSNKKLLTSLGEVAFKKTLFTNRQTGERHYLLDQILGMEPHERITEDAEVKMYEEAAETSYRRGGEEISITSDRVSKQTVKNKIHRLRFPEDKKECKVKRTVEYLYIDADEDHISLQFREKKGDLIKTENNHKNNGMITKLVYVYEGIQPEAPKSKRNQLINPYYFSGKHGKNEELWKEIWGYISSHYEVSKIKKIYLNGDGASWIKAGKRYLEKAVFVLDEFHLSKHITKLTSHMKDSQEDAKAELYHAIRKQTKAEFREIVERLVGALKDSTGEKRIRESSEYIQNNWMAARTRLYRLSEF